MIDNPENNVDENDKPQVIQYGKRDAYFYLLGLSAVSALIVFLPFVLLILYARANPDYWAVGGLMSATMAFGVLCLQWLLVIPATWVVFLTYRRLSRRKSWYEINSVNLVAIPLLFNFLVASSFFISIYLSNWLD